MNRCFRVIHFVLAVLTIGLPTIVFSEQSITEDLRVQYATENIVKMYLRNSYSTYDGGKPAAGLQIQSRGGTSYLYQWPKEASWQTYTGRLVLATNKSNENGILIVTAGPQDIEFTTNRVDSQVPDMVVHAGGGVSIDTITPHVEQGVTASLTVDGFVIAREFRVRQNISARSLTLQPTEWADNVFDADYPLMPLDEVKATIDTHRHLPGLPSEKEVLAEGVSVGEMQATLLRKIEELTLYAIEQDRQIQMLKDQLSELASN